MKNKKSKFKKAFIAIIILLTILILIFSSPVTEPSFFVKEKTIEQKESIFFKYEIIRYPASAVLSDMRTGNVTIGVSVETDNLNFGIIPYEGGKSTKQINLTSKEGIHKVELRAYGNIREIISFEEKEFLLEGNRGITVSAVSNGIPGNYTGEIDVIISRSRYRFTKGFFGY